jgi:dipeptide/tripeptide permease
LVAAGSSLGGVILPTMVIELLPKVGFGWTMRICAFLMLALLAYANFTVRSRMKPRPKPFKFMTLVNPLKERTFVLLTASIFFFYCKPLLVMYELTNWFLRGNVHSVHLNCC